MKLNKERLPRSIGILGMLIGFTFAGFFLGIGYNNGDLNIGLFVLSLTTGLIGALYSPVVEVNWGIYE